MYSRIAFPWSARSSAVEPLASAGTSCWGCFPTNAFQALVSGGDGLAPLLILAVILGLAFSFDQAVTKPVIGMFDSLSRILYQINSFFVEILADILDRRGGAQRPGLPDGPGAAR
ncbi:MAG: hypothetical protein M0C28_22620 [Candidatus Moduliflexus flocculans]|nr:hypothetical protein [Candidatus Moduliflexus flocculans]